MPPTGSRTVTWRWRLLTSQHYDAVLLDLGLPGKDGLEGLSRRLPRDWARDSNWPMPRSFRRD